MAAVAARSSERTNTARTKLTTWNWGAEHLTISPLANWQATIVRGFLGSRRAHVVGH